MPDRKWTPSTWLASVADEDSPFGALRQQIDSIFEDFSGDGPFGKGNFVVKSNVSETEDAITVTAELPGITLDDVDVSITGNRLSISGEKKSEEEEKGDEDGRQFHRVERRSGSFHRIMTLPFDIDPDAVQAEAKDGVLTVTVNKPPEAVSKPQKIEVKKSG